MNINILSRTTIGESVLDDSRQACNNALDARWGSLWIKDSISKKDLDIAGQLFIYGKEIAEKSDVLLILPTKLARPCIDAVISMTKSHISDVECLLCPDSLDPEEHEKLIKHLDGKRVTLLAISIGEEDLIFRANYVIYKKIAFQIEDRQLKDSALINVAPEERERVYAVVDDKSDTLSKDASENNYPAIRLPEDIDHNYLANSPAILLPLLALGMDVEGYLKGFYDTIASPEWDKDAGLFGYFLSKADPKSIDYSVYQNSMIPTIDWLKTIVDANERSSPEDDLDVSSRSSNSNTSSSSSCSNIYSRPSSPNSFGDSSNSNNAKVAEKKDISQFGIMLGAKNSPLDIMTPSFDGCDADGSLAELNRRKADEEFFKEDMPGFKIEIEDFSAYSLGSLMAFLQLSTLLI